MHSYFVSIHRLRKRSRTTSRKQSTTEDPADARPGDGRRVKQKLIEEEVAETGNVRTSFIELHVS